MAINKIYNNPADLQDVMEKYIASCKVRSTVKLRDPEAGDYLEDIITVAGSAAVVWIKAPSVNGFCNFAQISRQTYYNYRNQAGYDEVCQEFESICDEADMDSQYNRDAQRGAQWRLQLRGYETDKEREERLTLEQAREIKKVKHEAEMKTLEIKNKLLEIQLDKAKNTGEVDPLITQLIKNIGWGETDG